ncbi:MAG: hypothetical protein Q4B60_03675 [Erysipelotrichaceae bacterium]|nr:hypothetical protein [Erysipelotrichaceae bacterium]
MHDKLVNEKVLNKDSEEYKELLKQITNEVDKMTSLEMREYIINSRINEHFNYVKQANPFFYSYFDENFSDDLDENETEERDYFDDYEDLNPFIPSYSYAEDDEPFSDDIDENFFEDDEE